MAVLRRVLQEISKIFITNYLKENAEMRLGAGLKCRNPPSPVLPQNSLTLELYCYVLFDLLIMCSFFIMSAFQRD